MKKLMLALLVGLVAFEATAGGYRCYRRNRCEKTCEVKTCAPACATPCKVDFIKEAPCPEAPCCVRYVKVEEPALVTKHVSYSWECPSGCSAENKAAGMVGAGQTGTFQY